MVDEESLCGFSLLVLCTLNDYLKIDLFWFQFAHIVPGPNNCPFSACGLNYSDEIIAASTDPYGEDVCLYLW